MHFTNLLLSTTYARLRLRRGALPAAESGITSADARSSRSFLSDFALRSPRTAARSSFQVKNGEEARFKAQLGREVVYGLAFAAVSGVGVGSLPDLATISRDLTARGFDRGQESDADRFGLDLVHEEYGHVGSAWKFFERLATEALIAEVLVAYLSTHPSSDGRIDELQDFAREQGWTLEGPVEAF